MADFFLQDRFDWLWRVGLAQGIVLMLLFISFINFSLPINVEVRPYFILMAIYYWAIYRPTLLPPVFVFFIGVFFDLILNFPIGLHAVVFLLVQWIIRSQRVFLMGQPHLMVWLGFAVTCLAVLILEWLFFSLAFKHWMEIEVVSGSLVVSVLLFPPIVMLFTLVHKVLPVTPKQFF